MLPLSAIGAYRTSPENDQPEATGKLLNQMSNEMPMYAASKITSVPSVSMRVLLYVDPEHTPRPEATPDAHNFPKKISRQPRFRRAPSRSRAVERAKLRKFAEFSRRLEFGRILERTAVLAEAGQAGALSVRV